MSKSNSNVTSLDLRNSGVIGTGSRKGGRAIAQYGIFVIFGGFYTLFTIFRPGFFSLGNLYDILIETSLISFVSWGQAIVITAGGLDLSVGNVAGVAAMLTCHLLTNLGFGLPISLVMGVSVGGLVGLGNGLMVSRLNMNSLIATLGTMFVLIGPLFAITNGVMVTVVPESFSYLGNGTFMNIPIPIYIMAAVFLFCYLFLEKTKLGRNIQMIGQNIEACRFSGIDVRNLILLTFIFCGLLSTFSGILLAARQSLGNVTLGDRFVLEAFIASMLGTVIFNGKNVITGTLFGAIFLVSVSNGLTLLGAGPEWMYFSQGSLLLVAILANYYSKRSMLKISGLKK